MLYTRTNLMRFMVLAIGTVAVTACGDTSPAETQQARNLVYCENPDAAAPSCSLTGYSVADDSGLRTKLEGCAVGGCHAPPSATFTLDLSGSVQSALAPLAATLGANGDYLVDEFNPDCSYMLTKLTSKPPIGLRMPSTPPYWSTDEIDCFRSYLHDMSN